MENLTNSNHGRILVSDADDPEGLLSENYFTGVLGAVTAHINSLKSQSVEEQVRERLLAEGIRFDEKGNRMEIDKSMFSGEIYGDENFKDIIAEVNKALSLGGEGDGTGALIEGINYTVKIKT